MTDAVSFNPMTTEIFVGHAAIWMRCRRWLPGCLHTGSVQLAVDTFKNGSSAIARIAACHPSPFPATSFSQREERNAMPTAKILGTSLALLALSMPAMHVAQAEEDAAVVPLVSKDLADFPGREMLMITVDYPPGYAGHIHRHDAHSFIYVLEGSVVMGVRGSPEVTLTKGQTFYEGPSDVHTVGRNASTTKPAKLVVVLLKKKGADVVLPAE
jgi:quercetin dioxygenase-like cupin family protein